MTHLLRRTIGALAVGAMAAMSGAAQAPALRRGISVEMPVTSSAVTMADVDREGSVIVAVTRDGRVYFDVTRVSPAALANEVSAAMAGSSNKVLYLKGDRGAQYARISEALDALRSAGVASVALLTSQPDPSDTQFLRPPKGLIVSIRPDSSSSAETTVVEIQASGTATFGDLVSIIDASRAVGANVVLTDVGN